ncbi:histidine kinase [Mycobacterium sp. IS-1496]|uniref:sensor histidine kinase n=1 Tax=Mycobacterium sp. IS-1496 TaxID=1772284 RepID=UPI0007416CFB|nr:sensor histidine kinase [Mycobacterium sp. IS-1496]KUI36938.1 histidine kinase [Mycobacterium sp. IS-1496]
MTAPARRRGRQLTVQGWLNVVLAVMGMLVLVGAFAGAILMNRTDAVSRELIESIQPSRVAAYRLQAALRDQETAVRGFAIAADKQFLEPYFEGQQTEREAAEEIRRHVGDHPNLIADLDAVEQATAEWRAEYAEPFIRSVTPGSPGVVGEDLVQRGKEGFDNIRALFHVQNVDLAAARTAGVKELEQVRGWRDRVLAGIIITFFVTALLLAILARSALVRPLSALAASCRRITEGHFEERIVAGGPRDMRSMASDVEDMRQRIVEELEASRAAREQLDEQTVELRRSNAELEQFAYVASHDLQEPLRKVASFCQLLEKRYGDQLDERGVEYIKYAVDGAKRMQVLINDLLTFSRVGRLSAAHTDVELDEALDTALSNLDTAIEESGAVIVRPEEPLPEVLGDPTLLAMLWQNLIGNAVKFRKPDTTPRIVIECERGTDDRDGQWLFTVSDNGIGIAEEFSQKVFVIFQRLHGRDAYSGTGIGLALCKKIVEYHGGTIWIDNSYTEGTRFRMTLPVAVHEQPEVVLEGAQ